MNTLGNFQRAVTSKSGYFSVRVNIHTLESVGWLHELTDEELLDVCDDASLDRWQNRIEDVNYLTKRRLEYLRWQKTGGVSMH